MANTVPFKLVTPMQVVFEGDAELVIAVTTEGEEGILPRHAAFLAALKPGVLRANVLENGAVTRLELATSEGFMQAFPDRVTVLVDEAVRFEEVVISDVRQQLGEATERQKSLPVDSEGYARERAAIEFASAKLRLTGHK